MITPTGSAIGFRISEKLAEVQSSFQTIEIYQSTDWGKVMLIDGAMLLTNWDHFFGAGTGGALGGVGTGGGFGDTRGRGGNAAIVAHPIADQLVGGWIVAFDGGGFGDVLDLVADAPAGREIGHVHAGNGRLGIASRGVMSLDLGIGDFRSGRMSWTRLRETTAERGHDEPALAG